MKNGILFTIMLGAIMVIAMQNTMAINSQDPMFGTSKNMTELFHLNNDSYYGDNTGLFGPTYNYANPKNNCTLANGPSFRTAAHRAFGGCFYYEGVNAYHSCQEDSAAARHLEYTQVGGGYTMSVWFKPGYYSAGNDAYGYFYGHAQGCGESFGMGQSEWYSPLVCQLYGVATFQGGTQVNIHTNAWNHAVCTYNPTEVNSTMGRMHVYLNGVEVGNVTAVNRTLKYESYCYNNTNIGRSGGFYFNGSIEELAVWNRPINSTEVTQLYNERLCTLYGWIEGDINPAATSVNNTLGCIYSREQYGVSNANMTNNLTFSNAGTTRLWGFQFLKGVHTNKFKLSAGGKIRIMPQAILNGTLLNGGFRLK